MEHTEQSDKANRIAFLEMMRKHGGCTMKDGKIIWGPPKLDAKALSDAKPPILPSLPQDEM